MAVVSQRTHAVLTPPNSHARGAPPNGTLTTMLPSTRRWMSSSSSTWPLSPESSSSAMIACCGVCRGPPDPAPPTRGRPDPAQSHLKQAGHVRTLEHGPAVLAGVVRHRWRRVPEEAVRGIRNTEARLTTEWPASQRWCDVLPLCWNTGLDVMGVRRERRGAVRKFGNQPTSTTRKLRQHHLQLRRRHLFCTCSWYVCERFGVCGRPFVSADCAVDVVSPGSGRWVVASRFQECASGLAAGLWRAASIRRQLHDGGRVT